MLYQVKLLAILAAAPLLAAVSLNPQIEADDDEHARKKLDTWLENTGYKIAEGSEPEFQALDDSGLPPEVAAVRSLADKNAELEDKLAAATSGDSSKELAEAKAQLEAMADKAKQLESAADELSAVKAEGARLVSDLNDAKEMLQKESQREADAESKLETLKAQLEEAVAAKKEAAAASPPADGSQSPPTT